MRIHEFVLRSIVLRRHKSLITLLLVIGILFSYQLSQPYIFRSPDEAANHVFITRQAAGEPLYLSSPLTTTEQQFFSPRSVAVRDEKILPGSFPGFVLLLGTITGWFGTIGLHFFQVSAILLGLVCWYRIVRRYWEPLWALASVVLVASHPVVVQFVTLPLFHAGLFLVGLLLTGLTLLRYQEQPQWSRAAWVGLSAGAALFIRPSEALWVVPAISVIMISRPKGWKHLWLTGLLVAALQLPWMIVSYDVFGSLFGTGYTPNGIDIGIGSATLSGSSWLRLLTPAGGLWNWAFLRHAWDYAIALFPVYSLASAVSLVWYFRRKFFHWTKVLKIGLIITFGVYFLAFYGTWELYPGALPGAFGTWNSYDRYWLPLFVGTAAGVIVFFRGIALWSFRHSLPFFLAILVVNGWTIWAHPIAGLQVRNERAKTELHLRQTVLDAIPKNSFLFAHGPDQIFIPDLATSFYMPSSVESWLSVASITKRMPTFLLIDAKGKSVATWNTEAKVADLTVETVATIDGYILAHVTN